MACCIVIALLITGVRRAWFALLPSRRPVVRAFAPPARRPGPGSPTTGVRPEAPYGSSGAHAAPADRAAPGVRGGTALIAVGLAWFVGTEVTAHVLHLIPHSDLLHAPGPLLVSAGIPLRAGLWAPRTTRASRSAVASRTAVVPPTAAASRAAAAPRRTAAAAAGAAVPTR